MQLENFLITSDELENFLINRKIFQSGLEKVLIANRKFSNQQRGRRLSADVPLRGKRRLPKKREEDNKKNVEEERESVSANASPPRAFSSQDETDSHSHEDYTNAPGVLRLPQRPARIPFPEQVKQVTEQTPPTVEPAAPEPPPAVFSASSVQEAATAKEKPTRQRKRPTEVQLTLHEQEIKQWYEELRGVEVSFSKRNVAALQALGKRTMTKDDFLNVTAILDSDTWFEEHKIGVDLYWIDRHWENKIIFLQRKKPPLDDKTPVDKYTANSMDKEKMRRRIDEMKANAAKKGLHIHGTD